jgi:hypothetical protein
MLKTGVDEDRDESTGDETGGAAVGAGCPSNAAQRTADEDVRGADADD